MKNAKLSLLLLTALAAQPFAAEAMFSGSFARFAAFAKTKATSFRSFFSSSTPRWSFANPFRFGKQVLAGTAVETPLVTTCLAEKKDTEPTEMTATDAYKRYMVGIIEKMGPGRKESCHSIDIHQITYFPNKISISMRCPRTTIWGNKSDNNILHALYDIHRLEKIKQRLDDQGFLTHFDKQELKIKTSIDKQQVEQQIKEAQDHIKGLTSAKIAKETSTPSIYSDNNLYGDHYFLHLSSDKEEYVAIAKSLAAHDKAEQETAKKA